MATPVLTSAEVERYSRQMLLPSLGPLAQKKILSGSVLVVGAGGLGCPVILYLAGAGVGRLGIADFDAVEVSNLHRQIAHTSARAGMSKAESAAIAASQLNPTIIVETHNVKFDSSTGGDLVSRYDVIVDACDNPGTRYMINDACMLAHKPLVSGAALGMNGQLSVYGYKGGPCYRCVFPDPPPRSSFTSCSDGGVLGPVPGLIAAQQAIETLKILGDFGSTLSQRLLVYDAEECTFRVVKLRGRVSTCAVCGEAPSITSLADSDAFCARFDVPCVEAAPAPRFDAQAREMSVEPEALQAAVESGTSRLVLDVRVREQFGMCALPGSVNIPFDELEGRLGEVRDAIATDTAAQIFVVCRRGIDSLRAVELLRRSGFPFAVNVSGGLNAWRSSVDSIFPKY